MNLKEVAEFLVANGYAYCLKGNYKFTAKFHRELKDSSVLPAPVVASKQLPAVVSTEWEQKYKQFIIDAKVPPYCYSKRGERYSINKYSEDGMKAFRKAIESGCIYEMLVMTVALYYKSGDTLKQAIGRYMAEGTWKSDYDALVHKASADQLKEHINEVTDDGQHSFTKLG